MVSTSETLLADLARGAEATRWTEFVSIYDPITRDFLRSRFGFNSADLDDLVQGVMIELLKKIPTLRYSKSQPQRFHSLLFRIASNRAIDEIRRNSARNALHAKFGEQGEVASSQGNEDAWRQTLFTIALKRVMSDPTIRESSKIAFRRVAILGESAEKVSEDLGLNPNAIYQIKNRITARLRAEVSELEELSPYGD